MRIYLPVLALVTAVTPCLAEFTVVRSGQPAATIHYLDQPGTAAIAAELQHYLQAVSGATVRIQQISPIQLSEGVGGSSLLLLYGEDAIGAASLQQRGMPVAQLEQDGFLQASDGERDLVIAALNEAGLRYGVCDLLEQIGVRWYMPAELGEEIPQQETIAFEEFTNLENPDFILRDMWLAYGTRPGTENADYALWRMHNKMGGVKAKMGHALGSIISMDEFGETRPECFPLINGERTVSSGSGWQPCTSNPEVIQIAAAKARAAFDADPDLWSFSLSPNDGWGGWCECDECTALDPPEFLGDTRHGKARRMLVFANAVAELLEETHPDRRVALYAYAPTVEPPTDLKAHPNVIIAVAHYGSVSDKYRPITDPTSPRNAGYIPLVEGWGRVTDQVFAREYYTGLVSESDGLSRVAAAYALAEDIPWYHEHNVIGINSEALGMWGTVGLNFYLAGKLMWDVDTDVPAALDDYFAGTYGPAAAPMRSYFETLRDIARERYIVQGNLFTEDDFPPLRALLDEAMQLAQTDKQRGRIQLSIDHFEYVQLIRRMYEYADADSIAAVAEFVAAHPDSLGFDRKMHQSSMRPPDRTEVPADLRYEGPAVVPASDAMLAADALGLSPAVRGASVWLVVPEPGEAFEVGITPRQMGRYLEPTAADLIAPSGATVETLNVGVKTTGTIAVPEAEDGMYVLRMNPGRMAALATSTARSFVLTGNTQNFVGPTPRLYILPAPDAEEITIILESTPPGETAAITIWDPTGAEVFSGFTHDNVSVVRQTYPLTDANRGAWSFKIDQVPGGYIEDALVTIRGALPYFATDPARLVRIAGD